MIQEKVDRMLSFYRIKLGEGLIAEAALQKTRHKFTPSAYEMAQLSKRIAAETPGEPK